MAEVSFLGETFRLQDEPNEFALMEFAEAAHSTDEEDILAGLAAIFRLLESAIAPEDWGRFRSHARKNRASVQQMMPLVVDVFEAANERPTQRPSDSSDGPPSTEAKSEGDSSSRVIGQLEAEGRPAWALLALQQKESRTA